MQVPMLLQGESLKRLLQGAAVGAVATMIIGFNWGGWMLGGTARALADSSAHSAAVAADRADLRRPVPTQRGCRRKIWPS